MAIDPSRFNIPNKQNLSFRQQIQYVEDRLQDQKWQEEAEARAEARARVMEQRMRDADERRAQNSDPEPNPDQDQDPNRDPDQDQNQVQDLHPDHDVERTQEPVPERPLEQMQVSAFAQQMIAAQDPTSTEIHPAEDQAAELNRADPQEGRRPEPKSPDLPTGAGERAAFDAIDVPEPAAIAAAREAPMSVQKSKPKAPRRKASAGRGSRRTRGVDKPQNMLVAPALAPLLSTPALLPGESPAEYDDFLSRACAEVQPSDGIETVLVHDYVGRCWEIARCRRLKAAYISSRLPDSLRWILQDLGLDNAERQFLVQGWMSGDPTAKARVLAVLSTAGWDESIVQARSFGMSLKTIEGIESQSLVAEASRAAAWRALIHHRADLADRFAQPQALMNVAYVEWQGEVRCGDGPGSQDDPREAKEHEVDGA